MSEENTEEGEEIEVTIETSEEGEDRLSRGRERLEVEADKAIDEFDQRIVDLLSWLLDTETRARIYVYLRQHPHSTSEEVAEGTGLYPSTVRESLAELHEEEVVSRRKRESEGAGNNPYEYTAIAPSDLVGGVVEQIQSELNTVFNLDAQLGRESESSADGPVRIEVEEEPGEADTGDEPESEPGEADVSDETGADDETESGDEADEPES